MRSLEKRWKRYEAYLARGDWHVHSRWSNDAQGSIGQYCHQARANGLKLVAFTEHVRRKMDYDYGRFSEDVDRAREEFPDLVILKGCEAKVLNVDGELDVPDHVLQCCEVVIGAFHSFSTPSQYVAAVRNMLCNPDVDIWGHPTLYATKNGIPLDPATLEDLIELGREREVLIEFNQKYRLPSDTMRALVVQKNARYVWGSDAHRPEALGKGGNGAWP